MKKIIKILAIGLLGIVVLFFGACAIMSESLPTGKTGPSADQLAQKMLAAVEHEAWQNTRIAKWTFRKSHHYIWDRGQNRVAVMWKENEVLLTIDDLSKSFVKVKGDVQSGDKATQLIEKAWAYFCNDSFWLIAPHKAYDAGVERSIVSLKKGGEGLLVSYQSGGVTPGDAYLWLLDENGLPYAYKMWVSIIPIGGIKASWTDWQTTATSVKIAHKHKLGPLNVSIDDVEMGNSFEEMGIGDPFGEME